MEREISIQDFLLEFLAEQAGPFIVGAAAGIGFGPAGLLAASAVTYFGPRLAPRLLKKLKEKKAEASARLLEATANLSNAEAVAVIQRVVTAHAPAEASEQDKRATVAYLSAFPAQLRASMEVDSKSGKSTCPADCVPETEEQALALFPQTVPPFIAPCNLPGSNFQLLEVVGVGGFGVVYKAVRQDEQYVSLAIKFCLDPSKVKSLQRESENLRRLISSGEDWSDGIVRLYGDNLEANPPYLVYEFMTGGDLIAYTRQLPRAAGGGVAPTEAIKVVHQIAKALQPAHREKLVHRDLKPANILSDKRGRLKLADFGLGLVDRSAMARSSYMASNTQSFRSGTALYMSDEQRRGELPDPRHDLYSLGVIWFQLLAGDFNRPVPVGFMSELGKRRKVPASHLQILAQLLEIEENRPADAQALLALLEAELPGESRASQPLRSIDDLLKDQSRELDQRRAQREAAERAAQQARTEEEEQRVAQLRLQLHRCLANHETEKASEAAAQLLELRPQDAEARKVKQHLDRQRMSEAELKAEQDRQEDARRVELELRRLSRHARAQRVGRRWSLKLFIVIPVALAAWIWLDPSVQHMADASIPRHSGSAGIIFIAIPNWFLLADMLVALLGGTLLARSFPNPGSDDNQGFAVGITLWNLLGGPLVKIAGGVILTIAAALVFWIIGLFIKINSDAWLSTILLWVFGVMTLIEAGLTFWAIASIWNGKDTRKAERLERELAEMKAKAEALR